ncbi:MAG: hypothetical protein HFP77_00730 [Methylococcales symbiont of Iophon sp. n. MRB-2018]|nr:MAG: hypothetical protein HFP77_00730 [Methylococcales symbiont of Iophon sp. n. MRB-2018]KAF3980697.1 MAG: hypothetical protein HFP76_00760 [Methylococcales symbiont of Iophon sp. n. MRB-2018]
MTKVAISPVQAVNGHISFNAIAGKIHTKGKTAGEALDALNEQLGDDEKGTLIIVQNYRPDCFFDATQQKRLGELMARWRVAKDNRTEFSIEKQEELDSLVELELLASADRAKKLNGEVNN